MLHDLKNIPMLYKRVPFDTHHANILNVIQNRKVTYTEAAGFFDMPGVGFHRSLWLLSLHCAEHLRHGQQTFVVPTGMQGALSRTSLAGVTVDDLRFPYPSFYMALPDYDREVWGGSQTQWHKIRGAFLWHEQGKREIKMPGEVEVAPENDRGILHIYLWGEENERSKHRGDDASVWTALDLNEMHRQSDDLEGYLDRILRDPSREKTDTYQDDPVVSDLLGFTFLPTTGQMREKQTESVMEALRIVFNALLYMDSDGAEMEMDASCVGAAERRTEIEQQLSRMKNQKKGRARKLKKELDGLPTDTVTWVGRSYRSTNDGSGGGVGTPQRRHWVRGHWWPRRDTIRNRIAELEVRHQSVLSEYADLKDIVARASTPEDTSTHLTRLAFVRVKAQKAESEINDLRVRMEAKRRWVAPYKKGSRGEIPDSHTYVIGG
jgi:hypothetical protein